MPVKISGRVIKGKGKGRKLGFLTANIILKDKVKNGVYAGKVIIGNSSYKSGIFVNFDKKLLEAHLIGFLGNLYGKKIEVQIEKKIRDILKFESDKELKEQIRKDIEYICSLG